MQTNVEVLKSEMRGLQASVADIGAKMDLLLSMQVQIVRLQEQQDNTKEAVTRVFSNMREDRQRIGQTESTVHRTLSFVRGGALVGAVLFAFAQWYVLQQLNVIDKLDTTMGAVDRRVITIESRLWPDIAGGRK